MAANRSLLDEGDFSQIGVKGEKKKKSKDGGAGANPNTIKLAIVIACLLLAVVIYAWYFGLFDFLNSGEQRKAAERLQPTAADQEQIEKQQKYNEQMLKSGQAIEAGS